MFLEFIKSEEGLVTTDWVFLTCAMTATSLATTFNAGNGVENLALNLQNDLANYEIQTRFRSIVQQDVFESGLGTWVGGAIGYSDALGNVLRGGGSDGEQMARNTYELEGDLGYAVMSFDMIAIDSWDGEDFQVYVNDEVVATASFRYGSNGFDGTWTTDNPNIEISMSHNGDLGQQGFSSEWNDQSMSMEIRVASPGEEITLGFGSTLDQSVGDESWAVDNITVVNTNTND